MDKIGDFILTLLHSVTNTHILHWQAPTLSQHLALSKYFEEGRKDLPQDSEVQNICDEIQQLIDQTIYKLKFLK